MRHLIVLCAEHFSELLGCLPTMFIVIQVDWGLKDKNCIMLLAAVKSKCDVLIAAWDIPLKAAAVPIIGSSLIGKYRRS